jgi:hypothetical protein
LSAPFSQSINGSRSEPLARNLGGELYQKFCNIVRGVETQRQWNDLAIARTTPVLFALYSIITLSAHRMREKRKLVVRTAAWYQKEQPTFSDAIAWVRRDLWSQEHFSMSGSQPEVIKIPRSLFERLTDAVCYAA